MSLPRAKKSFGQNFLVDRSVVKKIVAAAEIIPGETVLEIGPGTGILTQALVDADARVIAVEADRDLIGPLRDTFGSQITLIEGDILSLPATSYKLPASYKLIANIPYNITSEILFRFLTQEPRPSKMVLMVQREVADRIAAKPPDMSLLSVVCQLYADVKKVANVPKGAFRPSPKVDSAVISLVLQPTPYSRQPESVIKLAKAGFSHRRKQLHGNLASARIASSPVVKEALARLGLPPTARAENLRVQDWVLLHDLL